MLVKWWPAGAVQSTPTADDQCSAESLCCRPAQPGPLLQPPSPAPPTHAERVAPSSRSPSLAFLSRLRLMGAAMTRSKACRLPRASGFTKLTIAKNLQPGGRGVEAGASIVDKVDEYEKTRQGAQSKAGTACICAACREQAGLLLSNAIEPSAPPAHSLRQVCGGQEDAHAGREAGNVSVLQPQELDVGAAPQHHPTAGRQPIKPAPMLPGCLRHSHRSGWVCL